MMERIIKKEILKQCELYYTEKAKQLIMGNPIKIFIINKKNGTNYRRTEKTPWPVNNISRRFAKKICRDIYEVFGNKKKSE